ncbi:hypothetical protein FB567DRAFT_291509 [Paraphoma chrysanthemicola]|uniref:Uncharacterized protein n=1 Tax=Paraphoma chrysanthemicola TaxID=798071 RepID=A0A8K0RCN7_9PLEO|nr:hypothetical protein FB567DRAFT_291509 [Paraphoma chrysanthemicola]
MSIRINATVHEARAAAGHTKEQWDRFYFITKDEARQLSEAHKDWSRWILIPANEKEAMLERINARLLAEGIRPVEMIILKWRVSQLLRDIQRKFSEGDMLRGITVASSGSQMQVQTQSDNASQQSSSPQRSEYSPSESRPYDPIRDV